MSAALREYLMALVACALLAALASALLPEGAARRAVCFACGLLTLVCAVRPLLRIDTQTLARSISRLEMEQDAARTGVEVKNRELVSAIIKEKCETYILDKAAQLDLALSAEVTIGGVDGYPYPTAVRLTGEPTPEQKLQLQRYIERELAIPKEEQTWSSP